MDVILYTGQIVAGLGFLALQGLALWAVIEGAWWVYTKATGKEY